MSIFPVKISEWYVIGKPFGKEIPKLKSMLKFYLKCAVCGKKILFKSGYVLHSATYGGPAESWCSKKCLEKND